MISGKAKFQFFEGNSCRKAELNFNFNNLFDKEMMDIAKEILSIIFSWPAATILIVFLFRKTISNLVERLIKSKEAKAKVGPLEIELGKIAEEGQQAVGRMKEINSIMAKSRALELEITDGMFGGMFSEDQRKRMNEHISALNQLTKKVEQDSGGNG